MSDRRNGLLSKRMCGHHITSGGTIRECNKLIIKQKLILNGETPNTQMGTVKNFSSNTIWDEHQRNRLVDWLTDGLLDVSSRLEFVFNFFFEFEGFQTPIKKTKTSGSVRTSSCFNSFGQSFYLWKKTYRFISNKFQTRTTSEFSQNCRLTDWHTDWLLFVWNG